MAEGHLPATGTSRDPNAVLAQQESRQPLGGTLITLEGVVTHLIWDGHFSELLWLQSALDNVHHRKPRNALTQFQEFVPRVSRGQEIKEAEN